MNFYITIGDIQNRIAEFHQNNDMTPDFPEILRSLYKDHKYKAETPELKGEVYAFIAASLSNSMEEIQSRFIGFASFILNFQIKLLRLLRRLMWFQCHLI
jgi:hypothetical protein